jgi:hypothetical protein
MEDLMSKPKNFDDFSLPSCFLKNNHICFVWRGGRAVKKNRTHNESTSNGSRFGKMRALRFTTQHSKSIGMFFLDGKNNQKLKEHRLESWEQDVS